MFDINEVDDFIASNRLTDGRRPENGPRVYFPKDIVAKRVANEFGIAILDEIVIYETVRGTTYLSEEEQMPEYIVSVMPPSDEDVEPFDIPEWGYGCACATARRYRERGWEACVIDHGTPFAPWSAGRPDGPDIRVTARTRDEACIRARAIGCDRTGFRRMD